MKHYVNFLIVAVLMTGLATSIYGQEDKGKITVEITKEIDGEKRTFKGEYESTEEMKADPNYQEFSDSDTQFHFWSDDEDASMFFHFDDDKELQNGFFKIFSDDEDGNFIQMHGFGLDSSDSFSFNFDTQQFSEDLKEKLKDLGVEIEEWSNQLDRRTDRKIKIISFKQIEVTEVGDEFGKKGKVNDSNLLTLEDLAFYPNPSPNGRLKVRFSTPTEDELRISVSNTEGKEVYSRYFDQFSGVFSETIDLSAQKEGIYLLEISQGKKRITKKLIVE